MSNKTYLSIAAAIAALFASVLIMSKSMHLNENVLFSENVEALASGEGILGPMCSKTAATGSYYMKLCTSCTSYGHYAMDVVAFCPVK